MAVAPDADSNRQTLGYYVVARSIAAVQQTKPAAAAASRPGEKWTVRSIDR